MFLLIHISFYASKKERKKGGFLKNFWYGALRQAQGTTTRQAQGTNNQKLSTPIADLVIHTKRTCYFCG